MFIHNKTLNADKDTYLHSLVESVCKVLVFVHHTPHCQKKEEKMVTFCLQTLITITVSIAYLKFTCNRHKVSHMYPNPNTDPNLNPTSKP